MKFFWVLSFVLAAYVVDVNSTQVQSSVPCGTGTTTTSTTCAPPVPAPPTPPPQSCLYPLPHSVVQGDKCDANCCEIQGYCNEYWWCNRTVFPATENDSQSGSVVKTKCSENLFFNPNSTGYGGSCDLWDNLNEATRIRYRSDKNCIPMCNCEYEEVGTCSPRYNFREDNLSTVAMKTCPGALLWNQKKRICEPCKYVTNSNSGVSCC